MIGSIASFVVIVAIVVGIVALVSNRRRPTHEVDQGVGQVRRLYYHIIAFVALMVSGIGATMLVRYVVEKVANTNLVSPSQSQLALGMALTIVATPVWFLFWMQVLRSKRTFQVESQSLTHRFYLYVVLAISLGVAARGGISLLHWLFRATPFDGDNISFPLVWGAIWLCHWLGASGEGEAPGDAGTVRRLYGYGASGMGLVLLTLGVSILVRQLLLNAYDAAFMKQIAVHHSLWGEGTRTGLATAVVGTGIWLWHWQVVSRGDAASLLRQIYLYLLGVLGGAATAVVSLSILIFVLLQWLMGAPGHNGAVEQFRIVPGVIAAALAGVAVWGYHWAVIRQEAPLSGGSLVAAGRVYRYLVAGLGLGALASGMVFLVAVAFQLLVPEIRRPLAGAWWQDSLARAITFVLIGAPLWAAYWSGAQKETREPAARSSLVRRVFIYLVFGAAVLASLGSFSALLFLFLQHVLQSNLTLGLLQGARWSLGILLTAGAVGTYYWLVLQEDRRADKKLEATEIQRQPSVRKQVIILASANASGAVQRIEERLGYQAARWEHLEGAGAIVEVTDDDLNRVQEELDKAPGDRALIVVEAAGIRVVAFREQ